MENILMALRDILTNIDGFTETFLSSLGIWGALLSCLLIIVESILPVLPLCVFITLLFISFGNTIGFVISWFFTCVGCMLSFYLCRCKLKIWVERRIKNKKAKKQIDKLMKKIDKMKLSSIAVLVAIPFTPAFAVNIAAGLSNISKKKFLLGIVIGKSFMVYFWGYIGCTLIESLTHPSYFIKILVLLFCAFILGKITNKIFDLE